MTIPALGVGTGQAIQDCGLGMFKIGKAQDSLGFLAIDSGARLLLHGQWPPCHQTMIRRPALQFCPVCPSSAQNPEVWKVLCPHCSVSELAISHQPRIIPDERRVCQYEFSL